MSEEISLFIGMLIILTLLCFAQLFVFDYAFNLHFQAQQERLHSIFQQVCEKD